MPTLPTSPRHLNAPLVLTLVGGALALAACTTVDLSERQPPASKPASLPPVSAASPPPAPAAPASDPARRPGAYYQDDGPGQSIPEGLIDTPDAEPKVEPPARAPSRPYQVFGKTYVPITDNRPFVQRGVGSWYGKKFHGQKTASGEIYDMFKMTAAHPTLPIPSYARVTNLRNGRQVIVRVNDRGPFHSARIIDLSYTAALKLDYIRQGSAELEVERLLPDEIARLQAARLTARKDMPALPAPEVAPSAATATAPTMTAAPGGFFLQFGAYAKEQNALAMRERLLAAWPAQMPLPSVVQNNGLFRLRSGPFGSRELADEAARQLKSAAQIRAAIVQR